jgi:hypothetical protein
LLWLDIIELRLLTLVSVKGCFGFNIFSLALSACQYIASAFLYLPWLDSTELRLLTLASVSGYSVFRAASLAFKVPRLIFYAA